LASADAWSRLKRAATAGHETGVFRNGRVVEDRGERLVAVLQVGDREARGMGLRVDPPR
jgi:hypothetical protein